MWRKIRDEDEDDEEEFEIKHGSDPGEADEPNQQHTLTDVLPNTLLFFYNFVMQMACTIHVGVQYII